MGWFLLRKPEMPLEYSECPAERTHWLPGMHILVTVMLLGKQGLRMAVDIFNRKGP